MRLGPNEVCLYWAAPCSSNQLRRHTCLSQRQRPDSSVFPLLSAAIPPLALKLCLSQIPLRNWNRCVAELGPTIDNGKKRISVAMLRLLSTLQLAVLLLATTASSTTPGPIEELDQTDRAASFQTLNTTGPFSQMNLLGTKRSSANIEARQTSCPNPNTDFLCEQNFCFIYEPNNDGTAWATCCPVGWVLQLNSAHWATQKCVLNGVTEAPLRPLSCGGVINGNPGTVSGWGCAYSNQDVNGVGRVEQSPRMVVALALAWFGVWFLG